MPACRQAAFGSTPWTSAPARWPWPNAPSTAKIPFAGEISIFASATLNRPRTVITSHQIKGWDGFPLADWIADITGLPAALGNDADVAGLAEALGNLFGGRYWLGDLVTGILILGAVAGGAYFMMNKLTGTWRSQTLKKYEQRKQDQRERFDHDVTSRAREAAAAAAAARAEARRSGGQKGH